MSPPASSSPIMFCLPHSIWKKKKSIFPTSNPNKGRQHEQKNPVVPNWLYWDILESKVVGAETQQCNPVSPAFKKRMMALFRGLKQNPRVCVGAGGSCGYNFNFLKLQLLSETNQCLILWLYSDSPCTASSRPPIFKQTDEYWLLTLPVKDSLVGSREHMCVEWILHVKSCQPRLDPFSCCQGKSSQAAWTPEKGNLLPRAATAFWESPVLPKTWVTLQSQKGNYRIDLSKKIFGIEVDKVSVSRSVVSNSLWPHGL